MSDHTGIEWTDSTWNVLVGCDRVSPGCDNCYAIRTAHRMTANPNPKVSTAYAGTEADGDWTGRVNLLDARLDQPLRWAKPRRIFVNAQSDLFHDRVPDDFIARVWAVMALAPQHTFQILTKRHGRMRSLLSSPVFRIRVLDAAYLMSVHGDRAVTLPEKTAAAYRDRVTVAAGSATSRDSAMSWPLPNVHLGVSVEDQKWADARIPALLATSAAVRFLSCEPLLGPVDLTPWMPPGEARWQCSGCRRIYAGAHRDTCPGCGRVGYWSGSHGGNGRPSGQPLGWVIAGGESGPGARPMHPAWVRSLRDQCQTAGVAWHFKQWGEWAPRGRLTDGEPLPVDNDRTLILNVHGNTRGRAAGSLTNQLCTFSDGSHCEVMEWVGKRAAGRVLDGRTWDEYPNL